MKLKDFLNTPVFLNKDIQEVAELNFILLCLDGFKFVSPRTKREIQEIVMMRSKEIGEHEYISEEQEE